MQGLGLVLNGWQPDQPGEQDLMAGSQQMAGVIASHKMLPASGSKASV